MHREETDDILCGIRWILGSVRYTNATPKDAAQSAVTYADALIEALKETP